MESVLFLTSALYFRYLACCSVERSKRTIAKGDMTAKSPAKVDYPVLIVGAGPAGSTAAYYLAKKGIRVALCDKKTFPRQKDCGDAWCTPALNILEDMGVLAKMEADGIAHAVKRGGLISPFGYRCINTEGASYGTVTGCRTYAIKREIADEYLVRAAAAFPSVTLMESCEVTDAEFEAIHSSQEGRWMVTVKKTGDSKEMVSCRMLLICDGSLSYLAQKLGIIPPGTQPQAVCSHAYIKGHTWKEADGVMLFNKSMLPGYSALFRHYNDDVYLGTYVLPGGKATSRSIRPFEQELQGKHPYIEAALGSNFEYNGAKTVAPIRTGGVDKSYSRQCLVIGDAAGHVDPLTGEGIHTAMVAGKIAAGCVDEMIVNHNFSVAACEAYHLRCYDAFGFEFWSSSLCARLIYQMPIAIDAVAVVGQRRGQAFLDFFGEVMTGVRPKSDFAQPLLLFEITIELLRQIFIQYVMCYPPLVPQDIGKEIVDANATKKTGNFA